MLVTLFHTENNQLKPSLSIIVDFKLFKFKVRIHRLILIATYNKSCATLFYLQRKDSVSKIKVRIINKASIRVFI